MLSYLEETKVLSISGSDMYLNSAEVALSVLLKGYLHKRANGVVEYFGVPSDIYAKIIDKCIFLPENVDSIQSGKSNILTDKAYKGKIYSNGVLITESSRTVFGYDFDPDLLKDKDMDYLDGLELQFLCSEVISDTHNVDFVEKCLNVWDGIYLRWYLTKSVYGSLFNKVYLKFKQENGIVYPCSSKDEFNLLQRNGYKASLVSDNDYYCIRSADVYTEPKIEFTSTSSLASSLESWFDENVVEGSDAYLKGERIIRCVVESLRQC